MSVPDMPQPPSPAVRARMRAQRRRDTGCELALRSALHGLGLRYRVDARPLPDWRRRADVTFSKARVAVFVNGCFWHGCETHRRPSQRNREWWNQKIERNRARDRDTDAKLRAEGWVAIRVWEHDDPEIAARAIARLVRSRAK